MTPVKKARKRKTARITAAVTAEDAKELQTLALDHGEGPCEVAAKIIAAWVRGLCWCPICWTVRPLAHTHDIPGGRP